MSHHAEGKILHLKTPDVEHSRTRPCADSEGAVAVSTMADFPTEPSQVTVNRPPIVNAPDAELDEILGNIYSNEDIGEVLVNISSFLSGANVTYQTSLVGSNPSVSPFIRTTYSADWVKIYIQKGYFGIDPIIREGYQRNLPFDWKEISFYTADESSFFSDARRCGLGVNGLSIPLTNRGGHRGLFSLNSHFVDGDWEHFKLNNLPNIVTLSQAVHQKVTSTLFLSASPIKLAPREIECLHWVAEGKDVPAIAIILSLSEHTIRSYLKSVRLKLSCATISQAVYKATRMDLISPNL